jgi:ankyrin repeat protein
MWKYLSEGDYLHAENKKNSKMKISEICLIVVVTTFICAFIFFIFMSATGLGNPPLNNAAIKGNLAEIKRLIEAGEPIDKKSLFGFTALHDALYNADKNGTDAHDIAVYLISKGAAVDSDTLETAIIYGMIDIVTKLVNRGIKITPDELAEYINYNVGGERWTTQMIDFLLANGADINTSYIPSNGDSYTALGYAVHHRDFVLVQYLVGKGADVNKRMKGGETPLSLAQKGYRMQWEGNANVYYYSDVPPSKEIADYLKKHGAQ